MLSSLNFFITCFEGAFLPFFSNKADDILGYFLKFLTVVSEYFTHCVSRRCSVDTVRRTETSFVVPNMFHSLFPKMSRDHGFLMVSHGLVYHLWN